MKTFILIGRCALLATVLGLAATPVHASNKVSNPDITAGKAELEYRGGYDFDDNYKVDGTNTNKFVANYGVTDFWRVEGRGDLVGNDQGHAWTMFEFVNRLQLIKDHAWLPKLALQGNYKFALQAAKPDKFEASAFMRRDFGAWTNVANFNFETDIGSRALEGTDFNVGVRSQYRYHTLFEPGVELYMDFGRFNTSTSGPNKHQMGPVISGKITDQLKYEVGYLVGLTKAAPDGRVKTILTYGF